MEANRIFNYALQQDFSHSFELLLLLKEVATFLVCSCRPSVGCPIHITSAEFSVSALLSIQDSFKIT